MSVVAVALALVAVVAAPPPDWDGEADADAGFSVEGTRGVVDRPNHASSGAEREYLRSAPCVGGGIVGETDVCSAGLAPNVTCPAGMTPAYPLWMREQLADGSWTDWTLVSWYTCPSEADLLALIEREWTRLRPEPSALAVQPDSGWVYASIPTIAYAEDAPRLHSANLLGADVTIRATPSRYTWRWGDGETLTTEDPGGPYPDSTVSHAYGPTVTSASISVETTWSGHYRIADGSWAPFDTTIASTTAGPTLEVLHPRTHLVGEGS